MKSFVRVQTINRLKRARKRKKEAINLRDAKSVGVVYNILSEKTFSLVKEFVKELQSNGVSVTTIGYNHGNKTNEHYLMRKGFNTFSKKDLNWYGKPKDDEVRKFINKEFDILINLCIYDFFPVRYIISTANARFKVGQYFPTNNYHDMIINIEKEKENHRRLVKEINLTKKKNQISEDEIASLDHIKDNDEHYLDYLLKQTKIYLSVVNNKFIKLAS